MSEIETELLKATKFKKKEKDYDDRQDYLGAVVIAISKLTEDDYDDLSDAAADWFNAAGRRFHQRSGQF